MTPPSPDAPANPEPTKPPESSGPQARTPDAAQLAHESRATPRPSPGPSASGSRSRSASCSWRRCACSRAAGSGTGTSRARPRSRSSSPTTTRPRSRSPTSCPVPAPSWTRSGSGSRSRSRAAMCPRRPCCCATVRSAARPGSTSWSRSSPSPRTAASRSSWSSTAGSCRWAPTRAHPTRWPLRRRARVEVTVSLRADEPASSRDAPDGQVQAINTAQVLAEGPDGGAWADGMTVGAYGSLRAEDPAPATVAAGPGRPGHRSRLAPVVHVPVVRVRGGRDRRLPRPDPPREARDRDGGRPPGRAARVGTHPRRARSPASSRTDRRGGGGRPPRRAVGTARVGTARRRPALIARRTGGVPVARRARPRGPAGRTVPVAEPGTTNGPPAPRSRRAVRVAAGTGGYRSLRPAR